MSPPSETFLCPRCHARLTGLECRCGFSVRVSGGIYDFMTNNPACDALRREMEQWDAQVDQYDTAKPKPHIRTIPEYFRGLGEDPSAAGMLPALRDLDLRGKVGMEVGGVGHSMAMMMRSGCTRLFHLEISRESQRIAMRNLAFLPETAGAEIRYLNAPGESVPLPDGSVDFLMSFGTYHHTDRRRSIPEALRILKPGGMFYFLEVYVGTALLPFMWLTRAVRKPFGFDPGGDNPLSRPCIALLRRCFPVNRFAIRRVLDAPAFLVRYLSPKLAQKMYAAEMDFPGVTSLGMDFLKGIVLFSGQKPASP